MTGTFRCDVGSLKNVTQTPQGGLRAPAALTRVGVFTYRNPDGTVTKELRPADEVFHADALKSLANAPVTRLHPKSPVTAKNYRSLSVGHVAEGSVRNDERFVEGELLVQDADTVEAVERGDLREISCGYTCKIDHTSGIFEGEHYDQIQREIRYNHVALGPSNWGRAGTEVRLRVDGGAEIVTAEAPAAKETNMKQIRLDGRTYEAGSDEHLAAVEAKFDAADKAIAEATAKADQAEARADAAAEQVKELEAKVAELSDPARLDSLAAERADLIAQAKKVAPEFKCDGLSSAEIVRGALEAAKINVEGKSDDYARARFDAAVVHADAQKVAPATQVALKAAFGKPEGERNDSNDDGLSPEARLEKRLKERFDSFGKPGKEEGK